MGKKNGAQNGHDPKGRFTPGNSGGKAGRSGRKPHAFVEACGRIVDNVVLPKVRSYLAAHSPADAGWRWCADKLMDYGKGKPAQVIQHAGAEGGPMRFTLKIGDSAEE